MSERATLINPDSANIAKPGKPNTGASKRLTAQSPEMPNTSHLVIVDRYGNGVSMTSSIETGFGSRLLVKGFLLNNQLTDFSFTPKADNGQLVANRIQAGKRPRSSMSPTVVFNKDGSLRLLVGSPGGSRIIDYTARTILYHLGLNMPIADAIAAGNIGAIGRRVELEPGFFSQDTIDKLKGRGHQVIERNLNSGIHAIAIKDNTLYGGADPAGKAVPWGTDFLEEVYHTPPQKNQIPPRKAAIPKPASQIAVSLLAVPHLESGPYFPLASEKPKRNWRAPLGPAQSGCHWHRSPARPPHQ